MTKGINYWNERYREEGFYIHHRQLVSVDMEFFDRVRGADSYDYLEVRSKELREQGEVYEAVSTKWLQRQSRGEKGWFGKAYSLAKVLDVPVNKLVILTKVEEETNDLTQPVTPTYAVKDLSSDIGAWIKIVGSCAALTVAIYSLAILLGIEMDIAFPFFGVALSGVSAFLVRKNTVIPIPLNLLITSGSFYGMLTGAFSFYACTLMKPDRACEFATVQSQIAGGFYIVGCVLAFIGGRWLYARSKETKTLVIIGLAALAIALSITFGTLAPPC